MGRSSCKRNGRRRVTKSKSTDSQNWKTEKQNSTTLNVNRWRDIPTTLENIHCIDLPRPLTINEIRILNLGKGFIPTAHFNKKEMIKSVGKFLRIIKIRQHIPTTTKFDRTLFVKNPTWNPPDESSTPTQLEYFAIIKQKIKTAQKKHVHSLPKSSPFPRELQEALHSLRTDPEIVIGGTDKNQGLFATSKSWYDSKIRTHLANPISYSPDS